MAAGLEASGSIEIGPGRSEMTFTEEGAATKIISSSDGSGLRYSASQDGLSYDAGAQRLSWEAQTPEFPFPLSAEMNEMTAHALVPVSASDDPQDMAFGVTLGGLTLSDMIWNMFDPEAVMPRDPMTVMLDLSGQVTPYIDFFDPAQLATLEGGNTKPGELNALTLNDLTIEAGGAKLTGTGDFTFDNDDLESFDGMPAPTGTLELQADGANGLIDRLIELGVVSEQDAMGARMMLAMFAVSGSEPDSVSSTIEINDRGQILANGQRVK